MDNMLIIGRGNSSTVYKDNEGNIVKIPNWNTAEYISAQQHGFDIADKLKQFGIDVNLPESISVDAENGIIKEKLVPGVAFNASVYKSLDDKTKDKLAKDLADFMIAMHSLEKPTKMCQNLKECMSRSKSRFATVDSILNGFDNKLPKYIDRKLRYSENAVYESNDIADTIFVMTHRDLRGPNVLYDKETNRLGIIDFELAGQQHIYTDFISSPTSFHWEFMKKVIEYYNQMSKLEVGDARLVINPDKIKNLLICRTAQTIAIDIANKRYSVDEGVKKLVEKLKDLGLFSKAEVMRAGIKQVDKQKKELLNKAMLLSKSAELE